MVLWSLARSASSAPVFRDAEYFAVNILGAGRRLPLLAFRKAVRGQVRSLCRSIFGRAWEAVPVLKGAVATFECHSRHRYYGGDHIIVIGNVERYVWSDQPALLFARGKYQ